MKQLLKKGCEVDKSKLFPDSFAFATMLFNCVIALILAILLVSCGGGKKDDTNPATSTTSSTTTSTTHSTAVSTSTTTSTSVATTTSTTGIASTTSTTTGTTTTTLVPPPSTTWVPLILAAAPAATSIPVRSGIPFPKGGLPSLNNVRLEAGDGSAVIPAQFDTLAVWPDGSIKAALVQFVTDVDAARTYRIAYGPGVTRAAVAGGLTVAQSGGNTTVTTGGIKYVVNDKGLITALWRDANKNGQYETAEQVLGAGEIFMVKAATNIEFTASRAVAPEIAIEEQGPIRAVIRARGALTDSGGNTLIKYLIRYYAYAGSDKLDIDFTVIDDRPDPNVEAAISTLAFSAKSYGLRWATLSDGAPQYRFGLDAGGTATGTLGSEQYLLQNGEFIFDNGEDQSSTFAYSGVASGLRAPGWVALDSGQRHLALMVRDFWQQYPIELNVKPNLLTVSLFADRALGGAAADTTPLVQSGTRYKRPNSFYFARPGGAKTHQMRFAFGDTQPASGTIAQLNSGYQRHRLELTAAPSWYANSGVFGDINVGTSTTATTGYDAMLLQDIYIPSIERPTPQSVTRNDPADRGGNATMFGWRDYGDRLRAGWNNVVNGVRIPAFYNDTHVGANNFLTEFVRTGEQRWFELGEISTRHFADIDVAHGPRKGYWDRSYPMGQQPPGEIHALAHNNEDHQTRNMHWGHAHVSGLSNLYLLTGDKRSLEVLTEIANWWRFVTPHFFKTPFDAAKYREAERDYGWPLYVMNEYVRVTGDAAYHKDVNGQLVNYLIQWWQKPLNHIGYNPATNAISNNVIGVNDASKGTGFWTMTRMDNSNGTTATGVNPWMAGPLLSSVIQFYEQDKLMAASGKGANIPYPVMEDVLFQCMNYLVKYGYDAGKDWFVYSEVMRTYSGGHTMIDYPLAYLDRLYRQKLAAGQIAQPGWYDTQASWNGIAKKRYQELQSVRVGANTQSYGFYGYEMVFPVDFFKIMATAP